MPAEPREPDPPPIEPITPPPKPIAAVPKPWLRWSAVVLAALGWWTSLGLYRMSVGLPSGNPLLAAVCGQPAGEQATDCSSVLASPWGKVDLSRRPGGPEIPTAAIGMGYFALVGFWYLIIGPPTRARWPWHFIIVVLVGIGVWQSFAYTHLMHAVLHRWCLGCVSVHVINGLLGLLTLAAFPWRREEFVYEPHPRGRLVLAVFMGGMFLFLLHGAKALLDRTALSTNRLADLYKEIVSDAEYIRWDYQRQPPVAIPAPPAGEWIGNAEAPREVVAFLDYQCPTCRQAHDALREALERYPDALRVSYRNYPLDRECNPHVQSERHPFACEAAAAAEAARELGGTGAFVQMQERLYAEQMRLPEADYVSWAAEIGLSRAAFAEMLLAEQVAARIAADVEVAKQAGVRGTPTVFLDGRRVGYPLRVETWEALLGDGASQQRGDAEETQEGTAGHGAAAPSAS